MTKQELENKISKTVEELELREMVIIKFLKLILGKEKLTSKDLTRKMGLPQTHLYRLIHQFTEILEAKSKFIAVKTNLEKEVSGNLAEIDKEEKVDFQAIKNKLEAYQKARPEPDRNLDQFSATNETVIKRIKQLIKNGDLKNKEIAFLGDDDLNSVAAALTGKPKKITVFEIDERLINLIRQIAEENKLEIEIIKQDLSQPIDKKYEDQYDLVFTDPPYTEDGINLFLNQAIKIIKKNFLGRIYLCYGNSDRAREREVEIQKLILNHNLLIKAKKYHFSQYYGAESIGSASSLYVLDWTPSVKIVKSNFKKVYTNE